MYYRALVVAIVGFWLWTTTALLRTEWFPAGAGQLPVPTAYLWKLVFLHQQSSDLIVYYHGQRVGSLHVQPHREAKLSAANAPAGLLTAVGGFTVDTPWTAHQNVVFHGLLEMGDHDEVQRLELSAVFHEPRQPKAGWTLALDGEPRSGRWHYAMRQGDEIIREQTGTLAELLDFPELRSLGVDPATFGRFQQEQLAHASITAHRDKLQINGDEIDTYLVSLKDASGLESTIQMNQLGQILAVKTFVGVELLDGAFLP